MARTAGAAASAAIRSKNASISRAIDCPFGANVRPASNCSMTRGPLLEAGARGRPASVPPRPCARSASGSSFVCATRNPAALDQPLLRTARLHNRRRRRDGAADVRTFGPRNLPPAPLFLGRDVRQDKLAFEIRPRPRCRSRYSSTTAQSGPTSPGSGNRGGRNANVRRRGVGMAAAPPVSGSCRMRLCNQSPASSGTRSGGGAGTARPGCRVYSTAAISSSSTARPGADPNRRDRRADRRPPRADSLAASSS